MSGLSRSTLYRRRVRNMKALLCGYCVQASMWDHRNGCPTHAIRSESHILALLISGTFNTLTETLGPVVSVSEVVSDNVITNIQSVVPLVETCDVSPVAGKL